MNAPQIVARLNDLDEQVCDRLFTAEGSIRDYAESAVVPTTLVAFLHAQVQARELRAGERVNVVRSLTDGIRRMKKAGSLQGLGRQACTELCDALGFDHALVSFVLEDGFVVEEPGRGIGGPTVIARRDCTAERECIRTAQTVGTHESGVSPSPGYQELLRCGRYLVAPVITESRVVALLHVSRGGAGLCGQDVDVLDTFASAYSLLHERMLNTERVQQQRTSIARAAAWLTEQADRIAATAISLDAEGNDRVEAPTIAPDSALAATLSHRERQVFERLVLGASNAEIADELVITVETVKTHVKRILRKIGAINRAEAIALYVEARTASLLHCQ